MTCGENRDNRQLFEDFASLAVLFLRVSGDPEFKIRIVALIGASITTWPGLAEITISVDEAKQVLIRQYKAYYESPIEDFLPVADRVSALLLPHEKKKLLRSLLGIVGEASQDTRPSVAAVLTVYCEHLGLAWDPSTGEFSEKT